MSKFNFKNVYEDRIRQIELDSGRAISNKKWKELANLKAEKLRLENLIKEIK